MEAGQVLKQYGNHMTHAITLTLLATVLGLDLTGVTHGNDHTHPEFEMVEQNTDKLNRILEINIVARLETLHKARCMGDATRVQVITEMEIEYREIAGVPYPLRTCDYYLSLP